MGANTPRNTRIHTLMGGTEFSFHVGLWEETQRRKCELQEEASFNQYLETTYTMHPCKFLIFPFFGLKPSILTSFMTWYTFRVAPLLPFHTSGVNTDGSTWSACCLFHVIAQRTAMFLSSDNRNPVNRCTNTACMSTVFVNECLMFVVLIIIFAAVPACMGKKCSTTMQKEEI